MNLKYSVQKPTAKNFTELFETTGWNSTYKLTSKELYTAIENSWYHISVYDGKKLIGFGRIICDGVVHALILDMIILPKYQGKGIGKIILDRLVKKCLDNKIRDIQLFCAKDKKEFYEKYGFLSRPDNAPGMEIKLILA